METHLSPNPISSHSELFPGELKISSVDKSACKIFQHAKSVKTLGINGLSVVKRE